MQAKAQHDAVAADAGRQVTFRRWLLAAGISESNSWTPTTTLYAAWRSFAGGRPGSMAWFAAAMRNAGVEAFRTNKLKGFRFKLVTVGEIAQSILAANTARERARRAGDVEALNAAVRAQKDAQRRAGAALEIGRAVPDDFGKISEFVAERWCRLTRFDAKKFDAKVADSATRAVAAMENAGENLSPLLKTIISPWTRDADGNLSRTISTPGEIPRLKGEGFQENSRFSRSETSPASAQRSQVAASPSKGIERALVGRIV